MQCTKFSCGTRRCVSDDLDSVGADILSFSLLLLLRDDICVSFIESNDWSLCLCAVSLRVYTYVPPPDGVWCPCNELDDLDV